MRAVESLVAAFLLVGAALAGLGAAVSYYDEALPTTLNPLFARSMVDHRSHELVFDRLYYRDAVTNELRSRLVRSYERQGNGKKLKLWFHDGVQWHDGKPFSSDDICFTVAALLDPAVPSRVAKGFRESLVGCESFPRENAAVITLRKAYHNPRERLGFAVLPKHAFQGQYIAPDMEFSARPVGTGPMKGSLGRQAVRYTAVHNPHHRSEIRVMMQSEGGDPVVQVKTVINGGVHGLIAVPPPLRPEIAATDEVGLKSYDLRSWWYIAVNVNRPPLDSREVRQALDHALDRTELRRVTIGADPQGEEESPCEFVSGPFVGSSPYYNRQVPVVERSDRAKVAELMVQAGAERVGGRWSVQGEPIVLKIGMNSVLDREAPDLLNQIGNQLQAAGFDRKVYKITPDAWSRKALTGEYTDFDLLIGKWSFGLVEDVNPLFQTRGHGKGSLNLFNYSSPVVDDIVETFNRARTDTEAKDAYHALHKYLAQDLPYLFLWKLDTKSAWHNEIRNNIISPYYCFTEFDQWSHD